MISRREFLKLGALAGAGLAIPYYHRVKAGPIEPFSQSAYLQKFVAPLRGVGGSGIPVATPDTTNPGWWQKGVDHYTIDIGAYTDQLHPGLPSSGTRLYGFGQGNSSNFRHLGGIIAARRDRPVQITFRNNLPSTHILPVDTSIMGADGDQDRADVHLHGGFVPWISDGTPHAWWDPRGGRGVSFLNNQVLRPGQNVPGNEGEYYYPNHQGARMLWYHDHTFGFTRLNAYSGIATAYVITDDYEDFLIANHHLPGPLDARTIYLVFQDKTFVGSNIGITDPTWNVPGYREGDLWYEHVNPDAPSLDPSEVPEFFGDTILVNGTAYPFLEVEQRQYRFRMLNACNARFLNPRLVRARSDDTTTVDSTEPATALGPDFLQIGTEGGFIPYPTRMPQLMIAPAERTDVIVDFRTVPAGTILLLYGDAPAPFPNGDDAVDYYPGNYYNPYTVNPGFGPNTRTLMQFRVKARSGAADAPITITPATVLTPTDPFLVSQTPFAPTAVPKGVPVRRLTLNEEVDSFGRLIQFLGTDAATGPNVYGREYLATATETIGAGQTEVWEILNLTMDAHPIHVHLVNAQVLSRQYFDFTSYTGGAPTLIGDEIAPDVNELGFKETVRMNPGQVTRVIAKFDLPRVPFQVPHSPRTGGHEYVWHCHILEHEEHDMMRPLVVMDPTYFPFVGK